MQKDNVLESKLKEIEDTMQLYVGEYGIRQTMTVVESVLGEYAKYRLDQFIEDHFPEVNNKV